MTNPTEHPALDVLTILQGRVENAKCDFKREVSTSGEAFGELVKDLCALANTDDDRYGGRAVLFIGVEDDGTVSGVPDDFSADALATSLTQRLRPIVAPPLHFEIQGFTDSSSGNNFGAIILYPPALLPHIIVQQSGRAVPGQWFVRHNTTTALAGPEEFANLHRRLLNIEIQPMRSNLDRLAADVTTLRDDLARLRIDALSGRSGDTLDTPGLSVAEAIRAQYATPESRLAARIRQEDRDLSASINNAWQEPWRNPASLSPEAFEDALTTLEHLARPFAEAAFEVVTHVEDASVHLALRGALESTVRTIVENRMSIDGAGAALAWYTVTLVFEAIAVAAINAHRYSALKTILTGTYDSGRFPMLRAMRVLPRAEEAYRRVTRNSSCGPLYQRAVDTLTGPAGWLTPRLEEAEEWIGYEAEFLLSLMWMANEVDRTSYPMPGAYLYQHWADQVVEGFVRRERALLGALSIDLPTILELFDRNVQRLSEGGCWVRVSTSAAKTFAL